MNALWKSTIIICLVSANIMLIAIWKTLEEQNMIITMEATYEEESSTPNESELIDNKFTISAYTARKRETNKDPHHTATMEKPIAGWTCAVSQDYVHWLGGRIYIPGVGVRRVNDLMHSRFEKAIDLFMGNTAHAQEFGKRQLQAVYLGR